MLERVLSGFAGRVPSSWRRSLLGTPDQPTAFATKIHNFLNRLPVERHPVLSCRGALKGLVMKVDWKTQRSFIYGTWEPAVTQMLQTQVKPGMTVLDIGAHVGYYTLLLAKCVGTAGRVFSFEPMPRNFARLTENIQLNSLSQVTAVDTAILARGGTLEVNAPEAEPYSGSISLYEDYGTPRLRVLATSLDEFAESSLNRLDFIKLDVEGAEAEVLEGGVRTVQRFRPVFLIELHHFDGNVSANSVPELLREMGYCVTWLERWKMSSHIFAAPEEAAS